MFIFKTSGLLPFRGNSWLCCGLFLTGSMFLLTPLFFLTPEGLLVAPVRGASEEACFCPLPRSPLAPESHEDDGGCEGDEVSKSGRVGVPGPRPSG